MTSENNFVPSQAELIKIIESYVIFNIINSFTSPNRFNPKIYKATDEITLKAAIYQLHDAGDFRETEEQRIKRLDNKPIVIRSAEESMSGFNDQYEKDLSHYKPTHYHEVLTSIRHFWNAFELKNEKKINIFFNETLSIYAKHSDCNNPKIFIENIILLIKAWIDENTLQVLLQQIHSSDIKNPPKSKILLNSLDTKRIEKLINLTNKKNLLDTEKIEILRNLLVIYYKIQVRHARASTEQNINRIYKQPFFTFVENFLKTHKEKYKHIESLFLALNQHVHQTLIDSLEDELYKLELANTFIYINKNVFKIRNPINKIAPLPEHFSGDISTFNSFTTYHDRLVLQDLRKYQSDQYECLVERIKILTKEKKSFENEKMADSQHWLKERPDLMEKLIEKFIIKSID